MASRSPAASPAALIGAGLLVLLSLATAWVLQPSFGKADHAQTKSDSFAATESEGASTEGPAPSTAEVVGLDAEEAGERRAVEATAQSTDGPLFGWTGTVVDEQGQSLAHVPLRWVTPWSMTEGELPRTDAEGRFALPYPRSAEWPDSPRAGISLQDAHLRPTLTRVPAPANPPAEVRLIASAADTWLPIRVLESNGIPRAELPVTLRGGASFSLAITDDEGRARLRAVSGEPLSLDVFSHIFGWLVAPDPLILATGENPELVVEYQGTPIALDLRAHDVDTGQPLAAVDWFGLTDSDDHQEEALAAQRAEFRWSIEEHGDLAGYCGVRLYAEGYLPTHFEWTGVAPEEAVSIPLARIEAWPVQLELSRGGSPIAHQELQLSVDGPYVSEDTFERDGLPLQFGTFSGLAIDASTQTDALGIARLDFPWSSHADVPKRMRLRIDGEDYWLTPALLGPQPWKIDFAPVSASVLFRFPADRSETDSSIDLWLDSGPNAPLLYQARSHRYTVNPSSRPYWAEPDRQGEADSKGELSFEIPAQVGFRWARTASSEERQLSEVEPLAPGSTHVIEVGAQQSGRIAGKILRDDGREWDGKSLALYLVDENGEFPRGADGHAQRWASGRTRYGTGDFQFMNVPPGSWELRIWEVRFATPPIMVSTGQEDLRIALQALCRLNLEVVDATTGARIAGETSAQVQSDVGGLSWSTIWNGEGGVEFAAGSDLQISLDAEGYRGLIVPLGDVPIPGSELTRRVELEPGRTLRLDLEPAEVVGDGRFAGLRILDADGNEIPDYPISFRTTPGRVILSSAPRQALQVHFVVRGTGETRFSVDVPAADDPESALTVVKVTWPGEQADQAERNDDRN